ncbi:hypothetical protein AX16_009728 [Volvariella volvacea WC 439]|nr:hypothetical protein AX16_009728 [Volvariella volvacea WC 439]
MADLASLRSQIKEWERSFRDAHGRNPTVDDIKQQPGLADKYKLYKKMSKTAVSDSSSTQRPPTTPPKRNSSLMPHNSRMGEFTDPLNSFNPFSPRKKEKYTKFPPTIVASPPHNTSLASRSPSSVPHTTGESSTHKQPIQSNIAVDRARKRLRGDPVSPSPKKQKLPRADVMEPPIAKLQITPLHNEGDSEDEDGQPFVENSPVKPAARGKHFKVLFDEDGPSSNPSTPRLPSLKFSTSAGLFGNSSKMNLKKGVASESNPFDIPPNTSNDTDASANPPSAHGIDVTQSLLQSTNSFANKKSRSPLQPHPPNSIDEHFTAPTGGKKVNRNGLNRVVKGIPSNQHGGDSDDEHIPVNDNVKVVNRPRFVRTEVEDQSIPDMDPILNYARRGKPRGLSPSTRDVDEAQEQTVGIDLPENLLRVLDLQSSELQTSHPLDEKKIAEELIYGRRIGHYNPTRGGEIWEVGESDGVGGSSTEGEQDWEGEPIPWAVGEL